MENFFIDKLNIVQEHFLKSEVVINEDGKEELRMIELPSVGKEKWFKVNLRTQAVTESVTHLQLEGSYSSSLTIRCDGHRVECYGNPSRYGRIDNLWGYKTIDECVQVYNVILQSMGLPQFTKCTDYFFSDSRDGQAPQKVYNGALITHIDFTRNLAVGMGNERPFLKGLSTQSVGRSVSPYLYPDENTVEWYGKNIQKNGSTYRYLKVYTKTADLLRHLKKNTKHVSDEDFQYYDDLIQFTVVNGVVREEHSFKREYLKRNDLCAYGFVKEEDFEQELQAITEIRNRLEVSNMKYETIADQLLAEGICTNRQSANSTQMYYSLWLHGEYMDKTKSQFREHKRRLLMIGIDISQKLDITRAPLRLKESEIIEVREISAPDWYRQPINPTVAVKHLNHLRLVA